MKDLNLQELAKSNEESLRFIAKEMEGLARRLKKTPFVEEKMDQYNSNLVEASFFLHSYAMATRSFNKMIDETGKDPECNKRLWEYFMDEVNHIKEMDEVENGLT